MSCLVVQKIRRQGNHFQVFFASGLRIQGTRRKWETWKATPNAENKCKFLTPFQYVARPEVDRIRNVSEPVANFADCNKIVPRFLAIKSQHVPKMRLVAECSERTSPLNSCFAVSLSERKQALMASVNFESRNPAAITAAPLSRSLKISLMIEKSVCSGACITDYPPLPRTPNPSR
jgi:hypothetical protein